MEATKDSSAQDAPRGSQINQTISKLADLISRETKVLGFAMETEEEEDESERIKKPASKQSLMDGGIDADDFEGKARASDQRVLDQMYEGELINNIKSVGKQVIDLLEISNSRLNIDENQHSRVGGAGFQHTFSKSPAKNREEIRERIERNADRLFRDGIRMKEKIAALQYQKYKEELSQTKSKPFVTQASKNLLKHRDLVPIHDRSAIILARREENLAHLREEKAMQKLQEERSIPYQPNIYTRRSTINEIRTVKEFVNQSYAWQAKKNETIQRERYAKLIEEMEPLTFRPQINEKSLRIVRKNDENIEQRFAKYEEISKLKRKKLLEETLPTFRPNITRKSREISPNRVSAQVSAQVSRAASPDLLNKTVTTTNLTKTPKVKARAYLDLSLNAGKSQTLLRTPVSRSPVNRSPVNTTPVSKSPLGRRASTPIKQAKPTPVQKVEYRPAMEFLVQRVSKVKEKRF